MLKIIAMVLALFIAGVLVLASREPDTFQLQRSVSIKAPAARIFPHINDFHAWTAWSPWENIDPALKRSYSGPESGMGAGYAWEGNGKVGVGSMEIVESIPSSKIRIKLDFVKPMEGHNITEFALEPNGDSTTVTWAMSGPNTLLTKVMHLFFSMDRMVGGMFEQGLNNLKAVSEK